MLRISAAERETQSTSSNANVVFESKTNSDANLWNLRSVRVPGRASDSSSHRFQTLSTCFSSHCGWLTGREVTLTRMGSVRLEFTESNGRTRDPGEF